jgi:hypothetical protein
VNPKGSKTTYRFQFGVTTAYGTQSAPKSLSAGNSATSVSAVLSGLQSGKSYHYRLVATNAGGVAVGQDRTFTTVSGGGGGGGGGGGRRSVRAVTSHVTPAVDSRKPFRFKVRGKVLRPAGVSRSRGCRGRVSIRFKAGPKTVRFRSARVRRSCRYGARVRIALKHARTLRVSVRFRGNAVLKPKRGPVRFVRAG